MSLSQDQHDDDDEENEADEAPADVDTRCEQHAAGGTHRGDTANNAFDVASLGGTFDRRNGRVVRWSPPVVDRRNDDRKNEEEVDEHGQ